MSMSMSGTSASTRAASTHAAAARRRGPSSSNRQTPTTPRAVLAASCTTTSTSAALRCSPRPPTDRCSGGALASATAGVVGARRRVGARVVAAAAAKKKGDRGSGGSTAGDDDDVAPTAKELTFGEKLVAAFRIFFPSAAAPVRTLPSLRERLMPAVLGAEWESAGRSTYASSCTENHELGWLSPAEALFQSRGGGAHCRLAMERNPCG